MEQPVHDATAKPAGFTPDPAEQKKLEQIFAASQPKLAPTEQPQPKPEKISELHRLKLENVSLRLMGIGMQFEKLAQERARLSRMFDDLRRECLGVYGVDVAATRIEEDGSFSGPLTPSMPMYPPTPGTKA